jgi:hypothetical protein
MIRWESQIRTDHHTRNKIIPEMSCKGGGKVVFPTTFPGTQKGVTRLGDWKGGGKVKKFRTPERSWKNHLSRTFPGQLGNVIFLRNNWKGGVKGGYIMYLIGSKTFDNYILLNKFILPLALMMKDVISMLTLICSYTISFGHSYFLDLVNIAYYSFIL